MQKSVSWNNELVGDLSRCYDCKLAVLVTRLLRLFHRRSYFSLFHVLHMPRRARKSKRPTKQDTDGKCSNPKPAKQIKAVH